jgi:hypothetical protein
MNSPVGAPLALVLVHEVRSATLVQRDGLGQRDARAPHELGRLEYQLDIATALRARRERIVALGGPVAAIGLDHLHTGGLLHATSASRSDHGVEQCLVRLTAHDLGGDRIGVLLIDGTRLTNATFELDAAALLHDVRRFVRGGEQIRCGSKGDVVAEGECLGAHRRARLRGVTVGVRRDPTDVVATKRALDRVEMGQRATAAGGAGLRCSVGLIFSRRRLIGAAGLHGAVAALHQRGLPGDAVPPCAVDPRRTGSTSGPARRVPPCAA